MIDCKHWEDVDGGRCISLDMIMPSEFCNQCFARTPIKKQKRYVGLGDTVKKMIDKVTKGKIKPCGGCKKRQEMLNNILPNSSTRGNDGS